MLVAVIVPAFNVAPYVRDTIISVLHQTHEDWALVVIDDGSSDATAAVASAFDDRRIHLIRQDNAGVSAARDLGVRYAGRFAPDAFLFLDGDDWLAAGALEALVDTLDASPTSVAASGRFARVDTSGTAYLSAAPPAGDLLEQLLTRNLFANGGHLLIRGKAVTATGGFRRDLCYGEDWEYCARLALSGDFTAVASRRPVLFVRDRAGSAYRSHATNFDAYRPAMDAIHRNPAIIDRLGIAKLDRLRRFAEAETAWAVGRELIRHGRKRAGLPWLLRSFRNVPSLRRMVLIGFSCFRLGPFRPYPITR